MARWRDRVYDILAFVLACWLLLTAGIIAAVLFSLYIGFLGSLILLFLFLRWLLKKAA